MRRLGSIIVTVAFLSFGGVALHSMASQSARTKHKVYPLWDFDEEGPSCRAKGRLQDVGYCNSHLMAQIIADGKDAIPILIWQLRDTRSTKEPIYDYWSLTTAGDIAYFMLNDLFTDSDWKTFNMPGLEALQNKDCHGTAEDCWRIFLKTHGRKFVQDQWLAAWNKNKDRINWDEKNRCFRLSRQVTPIQNPGNQ